MGDHSFSTYAKFPEELTFLTPMIRKRMFEYQGVRNVKFAENFAYVLNEWSLGQKKRTLGSWNLHFSNNLQNMNLKTLEQYADILSE